MPELPEVETIKNDLKEKIKNKTISQIKIRNISTIKNGLNFFRNKLKNAELKDIKRSGKLLVFVFKKLKNKKFYLLIHLKMTGQLIYCDRKKFVIGGHVNSKKEKEKVNKGLFSDLCQPNKYTRLIFVFSDNSQLFFNDLRKFGYCQIVDKKQLSEILDNFGIEPGQKNFTWNNFKKIFAHRKANVKALLLNQKLIAGIGNIYADEILFQAKINPTRPANSLKKDEIKRLFVGSKRIIQKAIQARGTTFSDYIDPSGRKGGFSKLLKVYGREGQKCLRCKSATIQKIKVAGRGTRYCPNCQRL